MESSSRVFPVTHISSVRGLSTLKSTHCFNIATTIVTIVTFPHVQILMLSREVQPHVLAIQEVIVYIPKAVLNSMIIALRQCSLVVGKVTY